jgi:hypothetical protein
MRAAHRPKVLLTLIAASGMAACASLGRWEGQGAATGPVVAVEVTNHNWMDIVVYAVTASHMVRLGNVTTGTAQRFELPRSVNTLGGDLVLEARPVGTNKVFRSQPILASPGARVQWSIENEPVFSALKIAN